MILADRLAGQRASGPLMTHILVDRALTAFAAKGGEKRKEKVSGDYLSPRQNRPPKLGEDKPSPLLCPR